MARSLLHKMVLKYFVHSGLSEKYQLKIIFRKDYIEISSPLWDECLSLCFFKNKWDWCINMPFDKDGEIIDFMFDLDSSVAHCDKGYYCRLCMEPNYFNSVEELIYDELFKPIIQDITSGKYEQKVRFGDGWAQFVKEENNEK